MVTPGKHVRAGTAKMLATVAVIQRHRHPNRRSYGEPSISGVSDGGPGHRAAEQVTFRNRAVGIRGPQLPGQLGRPFDATAEAVIGRFG
jgi:hypothetical protein